MLVTTVVDVSLLQQSVETAQTKSHTARFPDYEGDYATFQDEAQMARPRINSSLLIRQGGNGVTFRFKAERARLSRPSWRRRDQESILRDQSGHDAIF